MEDLFNASIVHYLCPICGNIADDGIIMNSLLTEKAAREVKDLHNKTIGFSDHCCKDCAEHKEQVVYCVGIVPDKCTEDSLFRSGHVVGIRRDSKFVQENSQYIKTLKDGSSFCLVAEEAGEKLGLWNIT